MQVLERFRRWLRGNRAVAPVHCNDLAGVLAREAGYLCNRVMHDYARMRTGRGWPALFSSPAFQERLDAARDRAAPLCLVWVTRAARLAAHDMLADRALSVDDAAAVRAEAARFDAVLQSGAMAVLKRLERAGGEVGGDVRVALERLTACPPADLRAMVSRPGAARFHELLPLDPVIDADCRRGEEEVLRNLLRLVLAGIHTRFAQDIDGLRIADARENSPISGSSEAC